MTKILQETTASYITISVDQVLMQQRAHEILSIQLNESAKYVISLRPLPSGRAKEATGLLQIVPGPQCEDYYKSTCCLYKVKDGAIFIDD